MNKQPTVLIMEDSSTQAQLIAAQLTQYDVNVVCAQDGMQGLRLVDVVEPDLVILDVNMPKLDGFQVCRRMKRNPNTRNISIIMLTSNDSSEDALLGLEAGADDYIPKDKFASQHLLAALEQMGLVGLENG